MMRDIEADTRHSNLTFVFRSQATSPTTAPFLLTVIKLYAVTEDRGWSSFALTGLVW